MNHALSNPGSPEKLLSPEQRIRKSLEEREKSAREALDQCALVRKWIDMQEAGELEGIAAAVKLGIFY